MIVRGARQSDLEALYAFERAHNFLPFLSKWDKKTLQSKIENDQLIIALNEKGKVLASAFISLEDERHCEIEILRVHPRFQSKRPNQKNKGVGKRFVQGITEIADFFNVDLTLSVIKQNERAICVYKHNGFTQFKNINVERMSQGRLMRMRRNAGTPRSI